MLRMKLAQVVQISLITRHLFKGCLYLRENMFELFKIIKNNEGYVEVLLNISLFLKELDLKPDDLSLINVDLDYDGITYVPLTQTVELVKRVFSVVSPEKIEYLSSIIVNGFYYTALEKLKLNEDSLVKLAEVIKKQTYLNEELREIKEKTFKTKQLEEKELRLASYERFFTIEEFLLLACIEKRFYGDLLKSLEELSKKKPFLVDFRINTILGNVKSYPESALKEALRKMMEEC